MNNTIKRTWNQGSMVNIEDLRGITFQAESGAHTFVISAVDANNNPIALSGTPSGTMLRPDNTDQALTCSVSGGKVYATLPAGCYDVPGRAGITIFLTSDGQKVAIYAAVVSVTRTQSGTASPGTTASVVDLVNAINTAISGIPATDTALKAAMAPTYSNSALYSVGEYAWYNGTLYRCTTAITTAETWTSGHWTMANLGSDLVDLKSALSATDPFLYPGQTINFLPDRLHLVNGTWSSRKISYAANRVCVNAMIHVEKGSVLHIGTLQEGIQVSYGIYQADDTVSSGYSSWKDLSDTDIVLDYTGELFVQFRRNPEASLSPSFVTTEISITHVNLASEISDVASEISDVASEISDVVDVSSFDVHQVNVSSVVETSNGTRLRIVKKLMQGSSISVRATYERGASVILYATEHDAIYATNNYIQTFGRPIYSTDEFTGVLLYDGYLSISEMKTDGTSISAAEKESFLAATTVLIKGKYSRLYKDMTDGSFVVKNELANGTIINPANGYAVRTVNYVSVYPGDTVIFGTNKPFKAEGNSYSYGYQTYDADKNVVRNLNYTADTTANTLLIEDGEYYVRFVIAEYSASPKKVQTNRTTDFDGYDVTVTIKGNISIPNFYFLSNRSDVNDEETISTEELNKDMDSALAAMSRYNTFRSGNSASATGYKKNFSLAIITDVHGSSDAFSRFINYVNSKKKYFDVALCTGDVVQYNPSYDVSWFTSTLVKSEIPFLFTVGNHDTADTWSAGITQAEARTKYFTEIESKNWITSAEFMGNGKCSWVKDFSDYNIRVISLFEYGNSTTIASDAPGSYCRRWMDSELLQWFADTLYTTPAGYSVIVLLHQVPNNQVSYVDDKFTAIHGIRQEPPHFLNTMNGNPVEDIVDAFMNSTVINQSYTSNSYIPGKTASVNKDFSGRSENGSFICYVCGHAHISYVLQSANYQNQKTIVVNTGSENVYQRQCSDTNYDSDTRAKDCFYGIGFDTQRRTINLVQLGGQETIDMRKRDFTAIPY